MSMNQAGFAPMVDGAPRRWDFLAGLMNTMGLKTFVEVGCKEGRTTGHILKTVPESRVVAIDPWCAWPDQANVKDGETYEKWDFDEIKRQFWENVGEHADRCTMLRVPSAEASERFRACRAGFEVVIAPQAKIGSAPCPLVLEIPAVDLVFIDAAHDYENVKADIRRWYPLVKEGGVLAGHDFNHKWPGVQRAVAECFPLMQIGVGPDSVWFIIVNRSVNNVRAD